MQHGVELTEGAKFKFVKLSMFLPQLAIRTLADHGGGINTEKV